MRYLFCLILSLFLTGECLAFQILRGSTVAGGASIAFVNGTRAAGDSDLISMNLPALNTTTGNTIIVGISALYAEGGVDTITDTASNTYTVCGSVESGFSGHSQEIWVATNVTGNASNVITITLKDAAQYRRVSAAQYSGLATSAVCDASASINTTSSGTTHTTNTTGTTAQANELVLGFFTTADNYYAYSASDPYSVRVDGNGDDAIVDRIVSSTGTYSITTSTASATRLVGIVRTFKGQ